MAKRLPFAIQDPATTISLSDRCKLQTAFITRNAANIAEKCLAVPNINRAIVDLQVAQLKRVASTMNGRQYNKTILMEKDYNSLENLNFSRIISEFEIKFPFLYKMILNLMCRRQTQERMQEITPRLVNVYSTIMFTYNQELSAMQKVISNCLQDSLCQTQVHDRLHRYGVAMSFSQAQDDLEKTGEHYIDKLQEASKAGKYIRLVSDNVDFYVGVYNETKDRHKHMRHMFANAALISEMNFIGLPKIPEVPLKDLTVQHILVSTEEYDIFANDMMIILGDVAYDFVPALQFMRKHLPSKISVDQEFTNKTINVPLPVLNLNEQSYADMVKILEFLQGICDKLDGGPIHFGGDLLTKIRADGAIHLRIGNPNPSDRFASLYPITHEFFHQDMNFLQKPCFDVLHHDEGIAELGTLKCELDRIFKHGFNKDVMKARDTDRDVMISFFKATAVEAMRTHFRIEDNNIYNPPEFASKEEEKEWVHRELREIIDEYFFPCWSGRERTPSVTIDPGHYEMVEVSLSNGEKVLVQMKTACIIEEQKPDLKKDYAHYTLEVGGIYMMLYHLLKRPDRAKLLTVNKMMMLILKGKNNQAKYPLAVLRMLIQQYSILPLQQACQVMQACFVNTKGKPDSHVPADQQMEWNVKAQKQMIKHLCSQKSEANIFKKSAAMPGVRAIAEAYDEQAQTLNRASGHHEVDHRSDVLQMMADLAKVKPFNHEAGRKYNFQTSLKTEFKKSQLLNLSGHRIRQWFLEHKSREQAR